MMKYIFVDVDGTLVDYDGTIMDSAVFALRKAKENGHFICICTGRNEVELKQDILDLPKDALISSNGAYIKVSDKVFYENYFDKEQLKKVISWLDQKDMAYYLASNKRLYASENYEIKSAELIPHIKVLNVEIHRELRDDINKISFILNRQEDFSEAKKEFSEFNVAARGEEGERFLFCDIRLKEINKEDAVRMICEKIHADNKDVIAIGDGMIDIPMFRYAGYAVAMGNAYDEVKAEADHITDDVNNNGVYEAFKYLKLIEEEKR